VQDTFLHQGESTMVISGSGIPPRAVIAAPSRVECGGPGGADVELDGSDSQGDIVSFEWRLDPGRPTERAIGTGQTLTLTLPLGTHSVGLLVTDSNGETGTAETTIDVLDTTPPSLVCPVTHDTECSGPDGAMAHLVAQANDRCSPVTITNGRSAGPDASGTYPLGTTQVTFTAIDSSGNEATCHSTVIVRDTTPPSLTVMSDPQSLWPPNHRMVPVHLSWRAIDRCDSGPGVILVSVTSSEPDDAEGESDGRTTGDIVGADIGTPDPAVALRAERTGDGLGRSYEFIYSATDASGNMSSGLAVVVVPHDLSMGSEPLTLRLEPASPPGTAHLFWNAVEGAQSYDLISGDLKSLRMDVDRIDLGLVRVPSRYNNATSWTESDGALSMSTPVIPAAGSALFYLLQYRDAHGVSGFGTVSTSFPGEPISCEGGCPGAEAFAGGAGGMKRK